MFWRRAHVFCVFFFLLFSHSSSSSSSFSLLIFLDISVLHKVRPIPVFQCFVYTFLQFVYVRFVWSISLFVFLGKHARLFIDDGSGDDDDEAAAAAATAEAVIFIYGYWWVPILFHRSHELSRVETYRFDIILTKSKFK